MDSINNDIRVLTGIKPTGRPHLGNYLGMIQPCLQLSREHRTFIFIADYHALTTMRDARQFTELTETMAATWLALGLDARQAVFYRQSAVPEIFELMWVLCCAASKGLLNRAHAYKAAVQMNRDNRRDPDTDVNVGLYNYPMLMAADILVMAAERVPVGRDQRQHVEIARDVANAFNKSFGPVLKVPEAQVNDASSIIAGIDGRKMSKSYGNEIPVLAPPEELRHRIMRIVTDSKTADEPKDPEQCNLFDLYRHFARPGDVARTRALYTGGGLSYKALKDELTEIIAQRFAPARRRFDHLMDHGEDLDRVLNNGAQRARSIARETLKHVRNAVGIAAPPF